MGTVPKVTHSIKDVVAIKPMHDCCNFAYIILMGGRSFITQKAEKMKECDSKVWSEEFKKCALLHLNELKKSYDYLPEDVDFCYGPKIEGGDNYNVYLKTVNDYRKPFGSDTFKRSVGIKLKNNYCYFARTTILHCTRQMQSNHAFMRSVYKSLLRNLKDGVELRKVYLAAQSFAQEKNENLAKHIEKELGFELCSNFKNESVVINSDSNAIAKAGMMFALNVNLIGLEEGGAVSIVSMERPMLHQKSIILKIMGTVPRIKDSIKDQVAFLPIHNCCEFAYVILKGGRTFIADKVARRQEFDSKGWSEEYQIIASSYLSDLKNSYDYLPEDADFCYAPMIEGGDNYNEYLKIFTDGKRFGSDTFKRSVGIRLKNNYCYFARTTVLHSTKQIRSNHAFMRSVYRSLLKNLKDGVELREVYRAAQSFAQEKNENVAKHIEKELGFELCANFKNESVVINSGSNGIAKEGMIFALNVNLIGLEEGGAQYNLYYSDTVVVRKDKTPMIFLEYQTRNITVT